MIPGIEALKLIARHQGDALVVTTETPYTLWDSISDKRELHLPLINSMSKASSIGLGLALAQPNRKVIVVDSDGSLLMNLGSLVTIANQSPPNLVHFLYQNDIYGLSGGQPVPGVDKLSFAGLARSAGYPNTLEFDDLEELALRMADILEMTGPTFVTMKVEDTGIKPQITDRVTKVAYSEVKEALERQG